MAKCPFCSSAITDNVCPSCGSLEGVDLEEYAEKETVVSSKTSFIFLDIDGVLNTSRSRPEALEPALVSNLARLLNITSAGIVLSSTWRVHDRLVDKALWLAGTSVEIERTPVLNWERWGELRGEDACQARCEEIAAWMKENSDRVKAWVALDDLPLSSQDKTFFAGRHIHTDPMVGLTPMQVEETVKILCHDKI